MPGIESISRPASGSSGCVTPLVVGFFGLFIVAGLSIGYFMSLRPLALAWQARSWASTACDVVSSRVIEGDETLRADIVYRYRVGGRDYTSNRYHFLPGSNSDTTVREVVARLEPGTTFECYVDPGDPAQAVINRTPTIWYYFGLIFLVMFALVPGAAGVVMLRFTSRQRTAERALTAPGPTAVDSRFALAPGAGQSGPIVLRPSTSPFGKLLIAVFLCLFWNSIVGAFTYFEYTTFVAGGGIGCMAAFLLLFQIVGLVLLGAVPYQILALANPRPLITLSQPSVPLGGSVSFGWELTGAAHRVTRLRMTLRGREEARYRRGTDTSTDTSVFFSETLVDVSHTTGMQRGGGTLRIPGDTMHTFSADNNKVIWSIQIEGNINRWPDVDETLDITVRPA